MSNFAVIDDIRQSPQWAKYLESIGWRSIRTSNGTNIELKYSPFGKLVKIQRPKALTKKDLLEIEHICRKEKAAFIKIEPNLLQEMDLLDTEEYLKTFTYLTPTTTIIFDLKRKENDLWNSISHGGKYSIKRAVREGAKVKIFKNPNMDILKDFEKVQKEAAKTKSFKPQSFTDLKEKSKIFGENLFIAFVYTRDNILCGGKMFLSYKNTVWYMHGGTTNLGRTNKTGYELMWRSIMYFKRKGFDFLDLEGIDDERIPETTKRWGGFSHFKEKFGGNIVTYPLPKVKYLNRAFKFLANRGYSGLF